MVLVSIGTAPVSVSMANLHLGVRPPRPEGFMTDRGWQKLCKGLGNSMPRKDIGQATRPFARSQSALHYGRMTEGGARGETVLFHDPQGDEITGEDQELGKNRQPKRDTRPAETVIQSREQQGPKENHLSPSNDGFLLAALFLCAQAALHQLGIALQEIN